MKFLKKYEKKFYENLTVNLQFKIRAMLFADLLIVLDLLSKAWADYALKEAPIKVIDGFFNFTLAYNTGVSFSMFNSLENGALLISTMAIIVGSFILTAAFGVRKKAEILGFLLIFAGAFGNGIDRIINGHVIDFLDVYYKTWHYPTFNLADCYIFLGVVIIVLGDLLSKRKKKEI